ncbi:PKD domain-containing protein, partial [Tenacibaculum sp. MEBiC06402]|uniref:PKD domain-containing protein n=1 Tax=Tenacibaculum sp. MEBiC06402 TaxID=3412023 RepID=UPI003B9C4782
MKRIILVLICFLSVHLIAQDGATTCDMAEPMCSDNAGVKIFNNVTNIPSTGQIGCLATTPNPAWFFIRVQSSGNLNFRIIQSSNFDASGNASGVPIDVDFVAWGPFASPDSNCSNLANNCVDNAGNTITCPNNTALPDFYINNDDNTNIVDCSYDGTSIETFTINNAQAGEFYILLITNFENIAGQIKLEQTNFGASDAGITDCSIIVGELGEDQTVCDGTPVTLDGTPITGTATSYEWQIDTGSGFTTISGETNATLTISNNQSGIYRVIITDDTGNTTSDDVTITYYPIPVANAITDINYCDADMDGFNTFDLDNDVTPQILGAQDANQFEVNYFLSQADADNNSVPNAIMSPYTNPSPFSNQTVFVRIHNTLAPEACYDITQFNLSVSALPAPSQPSDYIVCDDVVNGGDTDGFFNDFILSTKDSEVLGGLDPTLFNVSYHTTLSGAQTDNATDVIDKNNPYRNTTINEQTIFVRIENVANTNCFVASDPGTTFMPFRLIINPLPVIANNPAQINQCDTDSDLTTN